MITYEKLWQKLNEQNMTTYHLRFKGKYSSISSSTVKRLKQNKSVSTNTINTICEILECDVQDVITYHNEYKDKNK